MAEYLLEMERRRSELCESGRGRGCGIGTAGGLRTAGITMEGSDGSSVMSASESDAFIVGFGLSVDLEVGPLSVAST